MGASYGQSSNQQAGGPQAGNPQAGGPQQEGDTKIGAGGCMQECDSWGRYSGPCQGAASLTDGSIRVDAGGVEYFGPGKLAGADAPAAFNGRTDAGAADEPRSLLSATPEQLARMAEGVGQALRQGGEAAGQALSRAWGELTTNRELHKGLEFGLRAAGEVSKDVWGKVATHAGSALFGRLRPGASEGAAYLLGTVGGMALGALKSAREYPDMTRSLGQRIETTRQRVYGK